MIWNFKLCIKKQYSLTSTSEKSVNVYFCIFFLHSEYVKRSSWCNGKSNFKQKLSARVNQRRSKVNEKINVTWTCLRIIVSSMIVKTQKRYSTSLDKISTLTWIILVISSQTFSCELNTSRMYSLQNILYLSLRL